MSYKYLSEDFVVLHVLLVYLCGTFMLGCSRESLSPNKCDDQKTSLNSEKPKLNPTNLRAAPGLTLSFCLLMTG